MGFNTVLRRTYTTLLKFLDQEIGKAFAPLANYSNPQKVLAKSRELVEAIACGDTHWAAAVAKHNQLQSVPGRQRVFQIG